MEIITKLLISNNENNMFSTKAQKGGGGWNVKYTSLRDREGLKTYENT